MVSHAGASFNLAFAQVPLLVLDRIRRSRTCDHGHLSPRGTFPRLLLPPCALLTLLRRRLSAPSSEMAPSQLRQSTARSTHFYENGDIATTQSTPTSSYPPCHRGRAGEMLIRSFRSRCSARRIRCSLSPSTRCVMLCSTVSSLRLRHCSSEYHPIAFVASFAHRTVNSRRDVYLLSEAQIGLCFLANGGGCLSASLLGDWSLSC